MTRAARLPLRWIGIILTGVFPHFLDRANAQTPPPDSLAPGSSQSEEAVATKEFAPSHPDKALGLPSFRVDDAIVTPFEFRAANHVFWGSDYKAFFTAVTREIQRVRFPELIEDWRLKTESDILSMAISSAGLVYRVEGALVVLDEKNLSHIRTIKVPGRGPMAAVSRSPLALVQNEDRLAIVDTAAGTILSNRTGEELRQAHPANQTLSLGGYYEEPMGLHMSPDGAYAIKRSPFTVMKIAGGGLIVTGQSKMDYNKFHSFSGDSKYVALKKVDGESAVHRLSDPGESIRSVVNKDWLSFDPAAGVLYTFKKEPGDQCQSVVILGKRGEQVKSYKLENRIVKDGKEIIGWNFPSVSHVLVHPGGRNLLLFTHYYGCWFQYPPLDGKQVKESPDWLDSTGNQEADLAARAADKPLLGTPFAVDGLTVVPLKLSPSDVSSQPVWAADYRSFFTVSAEGAIRKISFPAMVEQRILELQTLEVKLALSKSGLVVMAPQLNKTFILDPNTLTIKKTIGECHDEFVASSPASKFVYVSDQVGSCTIWIYDTEGGTLVSKVDTQKSYENGMLTPPPDLERNTLTSMNLTLSPNGKHLLAGRSRLSRLKAGATLVYEEIGKSMKDPIPFICVSPDSKYVAACAYRNTYIFKMQDLSQPEVTIPVSSVSQVAFDAANKNLYLVAQGALFDCTWDGTQKKEIDLKQRITGILSYPAGHNFLTWGEQGMLWIQVPKKAK